MQRRDSAIGVKVLRTVQQQAEASSGERFIHSFISKPTGKKVTGQLTRGTDGQLQWLCTPMPL
jgi:hypothetical protein